VKAVAYPMRIRSEIYHRSRLLRNPSRWFWTTLHPVLWIVAMAVLIFERVVGRFSAVWFRTFGTFRRICSEWEGRVCMPQSSQVVCSTVFTTRLLLMVTPTIINAIYITLNINGYYIYYCYDFISVTFAIIY
jgi:hypothetical protein